MIHANGIESHRATFKRSYVGVYHHVSHEHLDIYSNEFAGVHNAQPLDTEVQMTALVQGGIGNRSRILNLISFKPTHKPAMLAGWNAWRYGGKS